MYELVYGIHVVHAVLDNNPKQILCAYVVFRSVNRRLKLLIDRLVKYDISVKECERSYLDEKVKGALHQGIIIKIVRRCYIQENNLLNFIVTCRTTPLFLILDGVTDPRNLGACLRTADAAGVHLVIVPRNRSVHLNSTVRKTSSGSAERVPFLRVTNLHRTIQILQRNNIWIVGTVMTSKKVIFDSKLIGPLAFVMGSEGNGIRQLTRKNCNELISIPMLGSVVASLNVAVAAGICLFEALRQRGF